MKTVIQLSNSDLSTFKGEKIYETQTKNARLIEFVLLEGDGISPHSHPYGEDCAVVLSGNLMYYINNKESINAGRGDTVFGWQNVIHGYKNVNKEPVHMLIFASPQNTGLDYLADNDPRVSHLSLENRITRFDEISKIKTMGIGVFENVVVTGTFSEKSTEKELNIFIDIVNKKVLIYENEDVVFTTESPTPFLRYRVIS